MSIANLFETLAEKLYKKGRADKESDFWNTFQNNGRQMSNYQYAFAYGHWNDDNYNPKYKINPGNSLSSMFYNTTGITDTKVDIDARYISTTSQSTNVFRGASGLKTIRKIIVKEAITYGNWFTNCSELENISFEGLIGNNISFADCPLLTRDSIIKYNNEANGIMNCLKDLLTEGQGRTCTLTLHADAKARLTESDIAFATEIGWTIA